MPYETQLLVIDQTLVKYVVKRTLQCVIFITQHNNLTRQCIESKLNILPETLVPLLLL